MGRSRRTALVLGLLAVALAGRAAGDDAPAARARIELSGFAASAVATGPRIRVPGDPGYPWMSVTSPDEDEGTLVDFQPPPFPDTALSPEMLDDVLRRLVAEPIASGTTFKASGRVLDAWGPADGVAKTKKAIAFLEAAYAPRLAVDAALAVEGAAPVASGAASLLPRRWTRVWWRREQRRQVVGYSLEVAQGAIVNRPQVASVPEGGELYLRWSPGEKTSLLEVYAAECAFVDAAHVDLSGVRNTPESSPMGAVDLPRTAIARVSTSLVVPAAGVTVEIPWEGRAGARRLAPTVGAPAATPAAFELGGTSLRVARVAAAAGVLELGARESGVQDLVGRFQSSAPAEGGLKGLETTADAFLVGEGSPAELDRLKDEIVRVEGTLVPLTVALRLVAVGADGPKGEGPGGSWPVGRLLSKEAEASLLAAKSPATASIRVPVLSGAPANVRVATSTTGFSHVSGAVAQNAAGIQPETGAWFDGLAVSIRAGMRDGGGASLAVLGTLSWVRPAATSADLAFRIPVGLEGRTGPGGLDAPEVRRVAVPLVTTGEARLDLEALFGAGDGGRFAVLSAASVHDDAGKPVTLLLLGAVAK